MSSRRYALRILAALLASASCPTLLAAESWPTRLVRLVVPYNAGGPLDATARVIGAELATATGQTVIVENVPGASGKIAMQQVLRSTDNHTIVLNNTSSTVVSNITDLQATYDVLKDFKPVIAVSRLPLFLVVNTSLQVETVGDFVKLARAKPGALSYASYGVGTPQHIVTESFLKVTKTDMVHIPYKGDAEAYPALLNSTVQVMFVADARRAAKSPNLRVLAVASNDRWFTLPGAPTLKEQGVGEVDYEVLNGIYAPASVPDAIIQQMNERLIAVLGKSAVKEKTETIGYQLVGGGPAVLGTRLRAEAVLFRDMLKKGQLTAQ